MTVFSLVLVAALAIIGGVVARVIGGDAAAWLAGLTACLITFAAYTLGTLRNWPAVYRNCRAYGHRRLRSAWLTARWVPHTHDEDGLPIPWRGEEGK